MSYSFEPFLESIGGNWYSDDELLQRLLSHYAPKASAEAREDLTRWGGRVAGPLRRWADESSLPENRPWLRHFDAYNRRVDEVVLPESTWAALAEVQGAERLGVPHGDPFVFYAKNYLGAQNGEAGVGCSLACTDGMVRVLRALGDRPEHKEALARIEGSTPERLYHGAQFVTEIQGGSDVPANVVRAVPEGDAFRLYGQKWFCSNITADYFLVTGRPDDGPSGGRGVSLFLVPAYLREGDPARNGYRIDRLKDKLGTRELPTAEVTFDGAIAYPVGPLDRGIPTVVQHVLVTSRFACASFAASALRQTERVTRAYAEFRTAFGQRLVDFPLVRETLNDLAAARERALATLYRLVAMWTRSDAASPDSTEALDFRYCMSLCKAVLTHECSTQIHEAVMLMGANGLEERFSPVSRLLRDSVIMETWEGPHNVLFSQALRDMVRYQVDPAVFIGRMAGEGDRGLGDELATIVDQGMSLDGTVRFARWARRFVRAFGEQALEEAGAKGRTQ